jgi:DNA modification methylase
MAENTLYYGDNLEILRRYIPPESVDLVYLDPPFKSDQNYNVLYSEHPGVRSAAQVSDLRQSRRLEKGGTAQSG